MSKDRVLNRAYMKRYGLDIGDVTISFEKRLTLQGDAIAPDLHDHEKILAGVDALNNEFFMYYLEPGEACAVTMVCAIKSQTSQLMAKAVVDTEVIAIPLSYMDTWMATYKSWYHFVVGSYRNRFEDLLQTIDHIAFRNMDERLVFYLRQYQQTQKSNEVNTSFTEIAQELNSSREVVSRLMRKLSEKGLIVLHKSHIEIVNIEKALS